MQQPNVVSAAIPRYADWLTIGQVAAEVGATWAMVKAWIGTGIKIDGGRIHLRAVKVGSRWKIDPAAVAEFIAATTAASLPASATAPEGASAPPKPVSEADLKRRAEACAARMKARGW